MNPELEALAADFSVCSPLFFALGEVPRQQILLLLMQHAELNVGQLVERLPLSRPAISHHLKVLRQAGLVEVRQQGTEHFHRLSAEAAVDHLARFVQALDRVR